MKLRAANFLNRSKSFYDDTTNTMRLSSIKSKLQNVSTSITNVNPFHKAAVNDAEESSKTAEEKSKRGRRRKHREKRSAGAKSSEPGYSHDSKHRGRKKQTSLNRQPSSAVKKVVPNRTTMDYVVSVDDTLSSVAARFDMTPSELCQLNRLVCRSLFAGQIIKVPKAASDETAQEPDISGETGLADVQNTENRFSEDEEGNCPPRNEDVLTDSCGGQDTEIFRPYLSDSPESESYSSSLDEEELTDDEADPMDAKYLKVQAEFVIDLKTSISGQILITTNSFVFTPNLDCVTDPNQYHLLLPLARIRSVAVYKDHSVLYFTKRDSHLVSSRLHSGGRTNGKSRSPLVTETLSPPLHTEIQSQSQLAETVEPVETSPRPDLMDTGLPDTSISNTSLVVDQKDETISQQNDSMLNAPLSSNTVVIPSDSDSMEYLCVLASKEDAVGKRHPVWFTLQSEEYWFRIPVEKGPMLFHFLQACEFDEEAIDEKLLPTSQSQLHGPAIHECMTSPAELCEATANSGTGGFVSVPNTYDWLLPRIGSIDERSRALLRLSRKRRRRVQSCKHIVSNAASIDQSMVSSTHSARSLDADTDTNSNVSKQRNLSAARSTPTLDEEKDALHLLKKESVRWEWIPIAFQHAWEHFVHWLVNSNEIKLQEAEEKRRKFILDSLKLAMPENLPLPQATSVSQLLDPAKVRDIMRNLPPDAEGLDWRLSYSTSLHGFSLRTLFYRCSLNPKDEDSVQTSLTSSYTPSDQVSAFSSIHPCLLVLCTSEGETFGAMLNAHPYASGGRFYGNGSCYVFRWVKPPRTEDFSTTDAATTEHPQTEYAKTDARELTATHIPDEELMKLVHQGHEIENPSDVESDESTEKGVDVSEEFSHLFVSGDAQVDNRRVESQPPATFEKFTWSGKNNFFIRGDHDSLTIGCAQGHSALRLDDVLLHGRTEACETFDSPPLCSTEDFIVSNLEVWSFF